MGNTARHRPHQHSVAACITASTKAHSSYRTNDASCPLISTTKDVITPSWATQLVMVLINKVSPPASQQVPRRTIIQDRRRKLSLNIKLTTNDVITPSWATQLVIVIINTVWQPASQQVPGRTHHTGLTIQAVCQKYIKQLTTSFRRHI